MRFHVVDSMILLLLTLSHSESLSQWELLNPKPAGSTLFDLFFSDSNELWIVGGYGTILSSSDEGQTWLKHRTDTFEHLSAVTFVGERGWAVGDNGIIISTNDGGVSWNFQQSHTNKSLVNIQFLDENLGWVLASDSLMLRTTNGGWDWEQIGI